MPTRRSFLNIIELLAIGQLASGCKKSDADLKISLLKGSVPPQSLKLFNQYFSSNTSFDFHSRAQLIELFNLLEYWKSQQKNILMIAGLGFLCYLHKRVILAI